jgi:glycosyltransferase involved in cell wall biosynthesis
VTGLVHTGAATESLVIHFVHAAATPHNNYLLDEIAGMPGVELHRHYVFGPKSVPGRPWKQMGAGDVQADLVRNDIGTRFDWTLAKLALFDRDSAFFVIGWDYPILVWLLVVLGLLKRLLIALINRTGGAYFCTGRHAIADIRQLGVRAEKLVSLPFFVREGAFDPALRAEHDCGKPCVLIVAGGRLVAEKGYDIFIEALAQLHAMRPDGWKAVLIGSGPEGDTLHARAAELGLGAHLDFVAWAESDKFASYVHSCDIFVAPARFDHFPTTVIAAMQAGVAVVATDAVGSAVEFIESGISGEVVPAGDAAALASAMRVLIEDPARRAQVAAAGEATMRQWPVSRGARMIVDAAREAIQCAA